MAAAAELTLLTVDEYRRLPSGDGCVQELHWGQVVRLTRPKMKHTRLQHRLVELLAPLVGEFGVVASEVPFRALPEYDLRGADVAVVSRRRWNQTPDDDNLAGSPELVIEVLPDSNTRAEMLEKAALCLSTGCEEFWVVDPKRRTIAVTRRQGETARYQGEDRIPIRILGSELALSTLFGN